MYRRNILFTDARTTTASFGFTGVMTQNPASAAGTGDAFADFLLGYPGQLRRARTRPPGGAATAPTGTASSRTTSKCRID